ncbi:MAG: hypothetical protein U1E23_09200 [Reyranellaceae bacterium]
MNRLALGVLLFLVGILGGAAWAQSPQGKAERRDPLFLRFPEMANRYWVNSETNAASHKVLAIPLPKQCAFVYADAYSRGQMSQSEVEQMAVSSCSRKLADLGPLGENYQADCRCQVVISNERYVVPRNLLPEESYGPVSIFYRDERGNMARLNGLARYGALIGRDRSVTFVVDNPSGEQVCEGTLTNDAPGSGRFSISCFAGRFTGQGTYQSKTGAPNDHILARGQTGRGLPVTMVIGLPAQLAASTYGAI